MSIEFRPSDLVPAGLVAEHITHIDDETCIPLPRADATAASPARGRTARTVRSRYCSHAADLPLSGGRVRLLQCRVPRQTDIRERFSDVLPP